MLRSLQYRDRCSCSWNRDGAVSLRRMPHSPHVHTWRNECAMFLLPHCQPGYGSESSCACKLRELPYATYVPVWRKVCQMCSVQFCDISWGLTWCRPEAQQLKSHECSEGSFSKGCFECTCIEFFPEAFFLLFFISFAPNCPPSIVGPGELKE